MSVKNCDRGGCRDVFHAFLVKNASYAGELEIPRMKAEFQIPEELISFSKCIGKTNTDKWVHFYEDDAAFERLWNHPRKYLPILQKYKGVISPDFSVYRDMPLVMQQWNIYRGRALGHWLQENGVAVVPNIRFGDERTFETTCLGAPRHSVIAVGTHGCMKLRRERDYFKKGLAYVVEQLEPTTIIVYGSAPSDVFDEYKQRGIEILQFDSEFMQSRKAVTE